MALSGLRSMVEGGRHEIPRRLGSRQVRELAVGVRADPRWSLDFGRPCARSSQRAGKRLGRDMHAAVDDPLEASPAPRSRSPAGPMPGAGAATPGGGASPEAGNAAAAVVPRRRAATPAFGAAAAMAPGSRAAAPAGRASRAIVPGSRPAPAAGVSVVAMPSSHPDSDSASVKSDPMVGDHSGRRANGFGAHDCDRGATQLDKQNDGRENRHREIRENRENAFHGIFPVMEG